MDVINIDDASKYRFTCTRMTHYWLDSVFIFVLSDEVSFIDYSGKVVQPSSETNEINDVVLIDARESDSESVQHRIKPTLLRAF